MFSGRCLRLHVLLCGFLLSGNAVSQERSFTPPVKTASGPVIGEVFDEVHSFKGIPYAAPPVGPLRWHPPVPAQEWNSPLLATAFGPACAQMLGRADKKNPQTPTEFYGKVGAISEDCLYLNIWTPATTPPEGCPVFVFFHGGRLLLGSGDQSCFNGRNFAKKGVVVVTLNYRVNIFGFLAHPVLTETSPQHSSGNYGLMDGLAALRWVRDNIAAFGGNPQNVTIGGEAMVIAMMAVPDAKGLFHRAIIDSASMPDSLRDLTWENDELASMQSLGVEAMKRAGITGDGPSVLAKMRALSWQKLLGSLESSIVYGSGVLNDLCIDGVVLKQGASEAFLKGEQNAVPMIIGTDEYEGTMFEHPFDDDNLEEFRGIFSKVLGGRSAKCEEMYPYSTLEQAKKQFTRMETDLVMANARYYAACNSGVQPNTYLYQFRRDPKWAADSWRLCFHGMDQAYVFGNLSPADNYDAMDRKVSDAMMDYWIQFMKTGDPNSPGRPLWPRYTAKEDPTLLLDDTISVEYGLRDKELDAWTTWLMESN